jgi:glyoxylase I family protein
MSQESPVARVTTIDHLYLAVRALERSEPFYDGVMRLLDFRKKASTIAGERHLHYFNQVTQLTLRPARGAAAHDPYAPGLHHLCFRVGTRHEVDAVARALGALGIDATAPRVYPEYSADYYASFFDDPDGIRLEVCAERWMRTVVRERWNELREFDDPVARAGWRR